MDFAFLPDGALVRPLEHSMNLGNFTKKTAIGFRAAQIACSNINLVFQRLKSTASTESRSLMSFAKAPFRGSFDHFSTGVEDRRTTD
jgi:hypothetical protein